MNVPTGVAFDTGTGSDPNVPRLKGGGRKPRTDADKKARAARLLALREALDISQDEVVLRSGNRIKKRSELSKFENAKNALSSGEKEEALAIAFNIELSAFRAYLDGRMSLDAVRKRAREVVDPAAYQFLTQLPGGLRDWIVAEKPRFTLSEVALLTHEVQHNRSYAMPDGKAPSDGWARFAEKVLSLTEPPSPIGVAPTVLERQSLDDEGVKSKVRIPRRRG